MASDVISQMTQIVNSRSIQRLVAKPQRLKRKGQKLINETLMEKIKRKKYQPPQLTESAEVTTRINQRQPDNDTKPQLSNGLLVPLLTPSPSSDDDSEAKSEGVADEAQSQTSVSLTRVPTLKKLARKEIKRGRAKSQKIEEQRLFPMEVRRGGTEYLVAKIKNKTTLQAKDSDVVVTVQDGVRAVLWHKVHTEFSQFRDIIPEDECMIGPVVQLYLQHQSEIHSRRKKYIIRIPHYLETKEQLSSIKVRCGDVNEDIPFTELRRKFTSCDVMPYYEVDNTHIIISTDNFSQFICTHCGKKESCHNIMVFAFGSMDQQEQKRISRVKVKVFLCSPLYKIGDFKKALRESMKDVGLHQLIQLSLPTKFDFNPKKSKVTTSLSVTDGYRWRARKKQDLSQRVGLCNAIDIWKCHTCKIDEFHYPAETASFDLKLNQLQHEFEGELAVTLHYRPQINCVNTKTTKRETIVVKKGGIQTAEVASHDFLQLKTRITDEELIRIARKMSCKKLESTAVQYLGLTDDDLEKMERDNLSDQERLKLKILCNWRNRNPGQNARVILNHLFELAAKKDGSLNYDLIMKEWKEFHQLK